MKKKIKMNNVAYTGYIAFYLCLVMLLIQQVVATFKPNAVPGKVDENLSQDSFFKKNIVLL